MRKVILLLLVSMTIIACSGSDNSDVQVMSKEKLQLSSEKSTVEEGKAVHFIVLDGSSLDVNADLYVDGVLVHNPYKFSEIGSYKVTAKKKGYENSNPIEITVIKKTGLNYLNINKQYYDIKSVSMSVEQISKIDYEASKEYYVDKAIRLPNGEWYNIYHFDIRINGSTGYERFEICYYVPNKTIVAKDNKIIDYGQRVLPSEVDSEDIIYHNSWVVIDNYDAARDWNLASSELEVGVDKLVNKGVGVGYLGLDTKGSFEIIYKDGNTPIHIVYDGVIRFCEKAENVSDF